MLVTKKDQKIHFFFICGLILKAINAIFEIFLGILFFFITKVGEYITILAQNELVEDPHDIVATFIHTHVPFLATLHSELFVAIYLLSHGILKILIVGGLLSKKLWMYPASLAVFALFIAYQLYRFTQSHSWFMIILSLFDGMIMWLTWKEYRRLKAVYSETV